MIKCTKKLLFGKIQGRGLVYIYIYIHVAHNMFNLGFYPFHAELLVTLAFPPLNSWGGGLKKIRIFCLKTQAGSYLMSK